MLFFFIWDRRYVSSLAYQRSLDATCYYQYCCSKLVSSLDFILMCDLLLDNWKDHQHPASFFNLSSSALWIKLSLQMKLCKVLAGHYLSCFYCLHSLTWKMETRLMPCSIKRAGGPADLCPQLLWYWTSCTFIRAPFFGGETHSLCT
jgi:hypothetical protein